MPTEHPACRETDNAGSNRGVEAPWNEPASRSVKRTRISLVTPVRSANLSNVPKPEIRREEMSVSSGGDLRGEWGQRAGKVELGRLGDPCLRPRAERGEARAETIRRALETGESERPVVALKRGNARGAKGPWQERSGLKKNWS